MPHLFPLQVYTEEKVVLKMSAEGHQFVTFQKYHEF